MGFFLIFILYSDKIIIIYSYTYMVITVYKYYNNIISLCKKQYIIYLFLTEIVRLYFIIHQVFFLFFFTLVCTHFLIRKRRKKRYPMKCRYVYEYLIGSITILFENFVAFLSRFTRSFQQNRAKNSEESQHCFLNKTVPK